MKIENLKEGQIIKNYKVLCEILEIKYTKGNSRKYQLERLAKYVDYHKDGNKFIIDKIHSVPRTQIKERKRKYKFYLPNEHTEFKGYYVYAHYIDDEVVYVGKGCKERATSKVGRKYNMDSLTKIDILKRFGDDEQEALAYEQEMIEYYQSIGQCRYNDTSYHEGYTNSSMSKERRLKKEYDKLIEQKKEIEERLKEIEELLNK